MSGGNSIQQFVNEELGANLRIVDRDGQPWFVAKDVATALGYSKTRNAITAHCRGGLKMGLPSISGFQEMTIIPESDVYRLILRSKLPKAEAFQDWVVCEVLPSIRKHGMYATDSVLDQVVRDPESVIALAQTLLAERDRRQLAEERLNVFKPKKPFGIPSDINGRPRTKPVAGYFRTTKTTTTITEVTEHQRRLFDFDDDFESSALTPTT